MKEGRKGKKDARKEGRMEGRKEGRKEGRTIEKLGWQDRSLITPTIIFFQIIN